MADDRRLRLFGAPMLEINGAVAPIISTPKAIALLGYLAHQREPVSRASLATLLWGETTEHRSRRNLTHVLGQLQTRLPGCFLADKTRIMWRADAPWVIDIHECAALLQSKEPPPATHSDAFHMDRLERAIALYRGELLADVVLHDSPEFDAWLLGQRERWRQQIALALETLSTSYATLGHTTDAERAMQHWIMIEPWQEEAYRALMRLLSEQGRRVEALALYERCRKTLAEELGLEPSAETVALRMAIIQQGQAPLPKERGGPVTKDTTPPRLPLARHEWGQIPTPTGPFAGRNAEVAQLYGWIELTGCRLLAIIGMGGIGKTALATHYLHQYADRYERLIWRSVLNAPTLNDLLDSCLSLLLTGQSIQPPMTLAERFDLLVLAFQQRRSLLVLDNLESIMQAGDRAGQYRAGYEEYGHFLQRIAQSDHVSCLIVTSREQPPELANLHTAKVRTLTLAGLDPQVGGQLLSAQGVQGNPAHLMQLAEQYSGNPLALRLIADVITDLYAGAIDPFIGQPVPIFDDIRHVLDQQMARLTALEQAILLRLAIEREPLTEAALWSIFARVSAKGRFLEALRSLVRRSLLERYEPGFGLQNVVMEYLTAYLIERVATELITATPSLLHHHPLLTTDAKEYVRQSQRRVIIQPLLERLIETHGQVQLVAMIDQLIAPLRREQSRRPSYLAGNVLNLLVQLGADLRHYDAACLSIWHADLRGADLPGVNLSFSDLRDTVFTDYVGSVMSLACSPLGDLLAAGTDSGAIYLLQTANQQLQGVCVGHTSQISALAYSPDGQRLASGSDDLTLRIWDVVQRRSVHTFVGHTGGVTTVSFHPDGRTVASGSTDQTVRIWDVGTGALLHTLQGHQGTIPSIAFSPDGALLASCSYDQTIQIWEWRTGQRLRTLLGHTDNVSAIVFCRNLQPYGGQQRRILMSASHDQTLRVWNVQTGEQLQTLTGHAAPVVSLALSADDAVLCSGSDDRTIGVWSMMQSPGAALHPQMTRILPGHVGSIHAVALLPQRAGTPTLLASASPDKTVRIWDVASGRQLTRLRGHSKWLLALTFTADDCIRVAGSDGDAIRVWDGATGRMRHTLRGQIPIEKLTFSVDGRQLVSAGWDATVWVWDLERGHPIRVLRNHAAPVLIAALYARPPGRNLLVSTSLDRGIAVWDADTGALRGQLRGHQNRPVGLALHPTRQLLASCSWDGMIGLWDLTTYEPLQFLAGQSGPLEWVTFDPSGTLLASGSWDRTVYLWDVSTRMLRATLKGHVGGLEMVVFSPDGALLASCGCEPDVCVWEVPSGRLRYRLQGHTNWVRCVAFNRDGSLLASGSDDGTVRIWDVSSSGAGTCCQIMKMEDPYTGMNIMGATGISDVQRMALKGLGAVETE